MAALPNSTVLLLILLIVPASMLAMAKKDVLYSGESLNAGEELTSGQYHLMMQDDCNLLLYKDGHNNTWSSTATVHNHHHHYSGCYVKLQRDGNMVMYTGDNEAIWSSHTGSGKGYYVLTLQNNGNLNIYGRYSWSIAGTN